jgi:CRISPR-associated protein Csc3
MKYNGKEANYKLLLTLLAYKSKYEALSSICGKNDLENCANSMAEESDLFYAVDPSLFAISFGLGIGSVMDEDMKFYYNVLRKLRFLNLL